ncbi:GNAT family N-acyltransferase [Marinomonas mediterranea]|uniref:L-ornithine N(alpha)-acyltransferase n=1 Tax=Marinomonas mediterranea (strain ATCC 700492 / JCM 21426 / NBRC 103028 / MMB-1) TaxID=717774 RepID=F2JZI4_MARM1|nr:GNAT family N-acyltransferase [Marinomonas mediterranea]ADZ89767.1 phospholipid/glycerol acyltransferase [Marinomonas mediterranea MMB-1]WCN07857.1 GNAT family N-acetyltransferase [Marinomonas mediterranea]WCN11952.1 GNAT family N-acetyltransferase [Marinomonas mediterranea]WCN15990.1 GNAT family N-acetyltransferase [Marinomonas mediterranea MMB-1]
MIQVEQLIANKSPQFLERSHLITRPTISVLRKLFHEDEVNAFLEENENSVGFEFIDRVLDHFNFGYQVSQVDRRNIPAVGRTVIVANHPLGALDGLALLRLIGEIRQDVKIVANDLLMGFDALKGLVLPVDNIGGKTGRKQVKAIMNCLHNEEAVIIFPAGEVSRLSPSGVKDKGWSSSYLKIAQKTNSPLLPVHIGGRNSMMFYTSSILYRPLSTLQLANEMFRQRNRRIPMQVGQTIPIQELAQLPLSDKEKNKLVKRHLYRIAKGKKPLLKTEKTVSHPQNRQHLKNELKNAEHLGATKDNKQIYLVDFEQNSVVMQEIGRLREIAFRKVGEGTGEHKDLDKYDHYYRHLVLWDEEELEIVGAYRIGEVSKYLQEGADQGIYSSELFRYSCDMEPYFAKGIELGRSFVQPKYWGKRSLDYLWYGIGAYLNRHPDIQYMFGPVSLSNSYPQMAKDMLVHFYQKYYADKEFLAASFTPYRITAEHRPLLDNIFSGEDYDEDFRTLKEQLGHLGASVPTLFKQYSELCEPGGVRFLDFGVDADFGYCVDGLVLVDLKKVKEAKRKRYLGE